MPVRYMGTKRHMASHVRAAVESVRPDGRVVDLFSGMGSVAEELSNLVPVVTNDALSFTACLSRARFTGPPRTTVPEEVLSRLRPAYLDQLRVLTAKFGPQMRTERTAMAADRSTLGEYMSLARHVGNDRALAADARLASQDSMSSRYCLACLYFSSGYFSLAQAAEIDAIRAAIDSLARQDEQDWTLGAWLVALGAVANAPGHTAQFLRPNSTASHERILRSWKRSVWTQFEKALVSLTQVGTADWRRQNEVFVGDALELVSDTSLDNIGAFYADPPYTRDQYSRYYHVYETLFRYDFPDSRGAGRNRTDRFSTGFSVKREVVSSFHDLFRSVARTGVPLILSYPDQGLLHDTGWNMVDIASVYFSTVQITSLNACHSTMGASKGNPKKLVTENLYVCRN